jgi:hypothetical protein
MIADYIVVSVRSTLEELEAEVSNSVSEKIKSGWQPYGDPRVEVSGADILFFQAMTKEFEWLEEDDNENEYSAEVKGIILKVKRKNRHIWMYEVNAPEKLTVVSGHKNTKEKAMSKAQEVLDGMLRR